MFDKVPGPGPCSPMGKCGFAEGLSAMHEIQDNSIHNNARCNKLYSGMQLKCFTQFSLVSYVGERLWGPIEIPNKGRTGKANRKQIISSLLIKTDFMILEEGGIMLQYNIAKYYATQWNAANYNRIKYKIQ